jgi:hypothetical protein
MLIKIKMIQVFLINILLFLHANYSQGYKNSKAVFRSVEITQLYEQVSNQSGGPRVFAER